MISSTHVDELKLEPNLKFVFAVVYTGRLYGDLRQQILKGPHVPSLLPEEREAFQRCVKDFCTRLQDWLPVPSRTVTCYLDQLNCLCLCT